MIFGWRARSSLAEAAIKTIVCDVFLKEDDDCQIATAPAAAIYTRESLRRHLLPGDVHCIVHPMPLGDLFIYWRRGRVHPMRRGQQLASGRCGVPDALRVGGFGRG